MVLSTLFPLDNPGDNTALGLLIKDLTTPDPATMHFKELAEKAGMLKNAKVGVPAMSQFWEDVYQDAQHIDMEAAIQALDIPEDLRESVITTTKIAAGK